MSRPTGINLVNGHVLTNANWLASSVPEPAAAAMLGLGLLGLAGLKLKLKNA
jgi:hypothetical protein